MIQFFLLIEATCRFHIVLRPQGAEFRAFLLEVYQEVFKPGITNILIIRSTKIHHGMLRGMLPIHKKLTRRRMDEQMPDSIPLAFREQREIAENAARSFIPGNQVKTVINEIGRVYAQGIEHCLKTRRGRNNFTSLVCDWNHTTRKDKEMTALYTLKLQYPGKTFKHLPRDSDVTTMFQPVIPGTPNTCQFYTFFSTKAWGSPPAKSCQPILL